MYVCMKFVCVCMYMEDCCESENHRFTRSTDLFTYILAIYNPDREQAAVKQRMLQRKVVKQRMSQRKEHEL